MAYFNYFIKQFLRLFVKKFFWVILIILCVLLLITSKVFAINYSFTPETEYFHDTTMPSIILDRAKEYSYFNNDNYGVFIAYMTYNNVPRYRIHFIPRASTNNRIDITNTYLYIAGSHNVLYFDYDANGDFRNGSTFNTPFTERSPVVSANYWKYIKNYDAFLDSGVNNGRFNPEYIFQSNVAPYIVTDNNSIVSWNFQNLEINIGTYDPYYTYIDTRVLRNFELQYEYDNSIFTLDIDKYFYNDKFLIPRNVIQNNIVIRENSSITFSLISSGRFVETDTFNFPTYVLTLNSQQAQNSNEDSDKLIQSEILSGVTQVNDNINNVNNNIQNLNNTLTDSSIDDITSNSLPQDNTNDITQEGINGIFTSIYNAFCVGQAQDIVFPIPFTNKSITLPATYTYDSLSNSNANFIIILIQAFWWYVISRFIIKDVANKINKIKSGDIESIEKTNIKEDML